jgi:serine/threonine-protein kinase
MLAPGTIVGDKYRLVRVLGRGGMGVVMEARHVQLGTSFALKFVHRSIIETASVTERFLREARATAALRSEHVCRVFDVGSFEGAPYLVMELLDGTDLERVLRREKRLAPSVACGYLIQACAGVAEAHAAEIVHRDLKPGNLFLMMRAEGTPLIKVLDFGIAKAPEKAELGLTGTDAILGSPAYMSLEQLRSSRLVDVRSDIWSLGVILYELVAGRRPFNGEGVADLALRIAMEPIPKLPHGPAALDVVIGKCLERDPARRYQDIAELALALAPFADEPERRLAQSLNRAPRASYPIIEITSPADPSLPGDRSAATQATELLAPSETTLQSVGVIERPRPARRSRTRIGLAALALTVAGGISLGIAATGGEGASPAAEPAVEPAVAATPAPPPPAPVAAPSPPPSPGPSTARPASDQRPAETVTLRFAVEPAVAAVELDGVFVAARQIKVHKDDAPHVLRITAAGFTSHEGEVRFDASQKLTIRLKRAPQTAVRPARPAKPQPSRIESHSPYE